MYDKFKKSDCYAYDIDIYILMIEPHLHILQITSTYVYTIPKKLAFFKKLMLNLMYISWKKKTNLSTYRRISNLFYEFLKINISEHIKYLIVKSDFFNSFTIPHIKEEVSVKK